MVATRSGRVTKVVSAENVAKQIAKRARKTATPKPAKPQPAKTRPKKTMASGSSSEGEPLYFWRESHPELGYLSQWYYCPFKDDKDPSKTYKTAEHYMMHHKALLFNDEKIALQVLKAEHPRGVKALGRKVKNFDDATWNKNREAIVRRGNILKFTNAITEVGFQKGTVAKKNLPPIEGSLRGMLLATGDAEIVEASPFDRIWGIGFKAADAEVAKEHWGLNLLGKELMEVRRILKEEQERQEEQQQEKK